MARILGSLLLIAVVAYGIWPYYTLFRLDTALADSDARAIAPFVDLPAVQRRYKQRLGETVGGFVPRGNSEGEQVIGWLAENLARLGDAALEQAITIQWVRNTIRTAAERATDKRPAYLIAGIDFAFFESWDRFMVRLGPVGEGTHLLFSLQGTEWRITDIVR